jgi:ribonuclease D
MDVVLLPEMLVKLRGMLDAAGRWTWLQEDVARVQRNARQAIDPDTVYQRFPGIGRMDQDTLQVLKYLARWREETAIERNRARGFVIADAPILQMAREKPVSKEQLQAIEGIHPIALSRYAETLLKLIELAGQDRTPVETLDRLDDKQRSQLNQMRAIVAKRAADLGVEPALLASRRELERLIRAHASDQPVPERFLGWRKQEVTDELVKILDQ